MISSIRRIGIALLVAGPCALATAQVTFYEADNFHGRTFRADKAVNNFSSVGFNDRASSVIVDRGRWEVCDDADFNGRCVVLRQGSYDSLAGMGLNDRVSSVRPFNGRGDHVEAPAPLAAPTYNYRRRPGERLYEVPVRSARAVMGPPEQRCWTEREEINQPSTPATIGRGVLGAVIGGVIGHQIGGGTGRDIATVGGAVAGGAIGANVGRDRGGQGRDVQRCENVANAGSPSFWDVTYDYQGVQHTVQLSADPGRTVLVNRSGEPRM